MLVTGHRRTARKKKKYVFKEEKYSPVILTGRFDNTHLSAVEAKQYKTETLLLVLYCLPCLHC